MSGSVRRATGVVVMTYNIKSAAYHPGGLAALASVVAPAEPDVVALQEVDHGTVRSGGIDQAAALGSRVSLSHVHFAAAVPWEGGGEYGLALLARWPLQDVAVKRLPTPTGIAVPASDREPRIALGARLVTPVGRLAVVNAHLGLTADQRGDQARVLAGFVSAYAGADPVALLGDLNAEPGSVELSPLTRALVDAFRHVPRGWRWSFPAGAREDAPEGEGRLACDHILIGGGLRSVGPAVVWDATHASDHNPLRATLVRSGG